MGMKVNNPVTKPTDTQLVFDKLKKEIITTLAPRLLGLMQEFGYDVLNTNVSGSIHTVSIHKNELEEIANSKNLKKYFANTTSKETIHKDLFNVFRKYRAATEHLMKLRSEAERCVEWIDKIGSVGTRKVITEKTDNKNKK